MSAFTRHASVSDITGLDGTPTTHDASHVSSTRSTDMGSTTDSSDSHTTGHILDDASTRT